MFLFCFFAQDDPVTVPNGNHRGNGNSNGYATGTMDSSAYGFSRGGKKQPVPKNVVNDSIDDLPLPPPPTQNGISPKRVGSQQPTTTSSSSGSASLPHVPPKIDRLKKPSRRSSQEQQQRMHNGSGEQQQPESMYSTRGGSSSNKPSSGSLDRNAHLRDLKMVKTGMFERECVICLVFNDVFFSF